MLVILQIVKKLKIKLKQIKIKLVKNNNFGLFIKDFASEIDDDSMFVELFQEMSNEKRANAAVIIPSGISNRKRW